MTKDDAIAILQGVAKYLMSGNEILYSDKLMLALDVAIKALGTKDVPDTNADTISRQAALDVCNNAIDLWEGQLGEGIVIAVKKKISELPSAQPDRDIPMKPTETTDKSWGIPHRQAVCPKCDYYLGIVHFIGEGDRRKVTYCETCGQAIDWEGWEFDG